MAIPLVLTKLHRPRLRPKLVAVSPFLNLILMAAALAACGGKPAEVAGTGNPAQPLVTEQQGQANTPRPPQPAVGGAWVYASDSEPDTLDVHRTVSGASEFVMKLVGGSVLALDPVTGEFIPYLAESYSLSEDGRLWEIKFKEDLQWHDGTPFTAQDYVWTMERVLASPSPATGAMTAGMASAEAVDDRTVRIHMDRPNSGMLFGLTSAYMQPMPRADIERVGDEEYGRHPIGMGPYRLKEWRTGDRLILERNPDFNWGPAYAHPGPAYIEFVEFRVIPEYSTRLAGIESGEIDAAFLMNKDVARIEGLGGFDIIPIDHQGAGPYLLFNVSAPPFDDIRVRKAFNLAVNREELIRAVALGYGEPLWGLITPATYGHWDGDKEIGYGYDPDAARALMAEAGYQLNGDGLLEKDGQPFELDFKVTPSIRSNTIKIAEVLSEQFKALGVRLEIQQLERGVLQEAIASGDYTLSIGFWGWAEAQIIAPLFLSSMIGGMNESHVNDPEFDPILLAVLAEPDREVLQERLNAAQRYVIEKAYTAPLFTIRVHLALRRRATNVIVRPVTEEIELFDAYIETSP
jgi:peptide/nickel transport system substrate-binding protein